MENGSAKAPTYERPEKKALMKELSYGRFGLDPRTPKNVKGFWAPQEIKSKPFRGTSSLVAGCYKQKAIDLLWLIHHSKKSISLKPRLRKR